MLTRNECCSSSRCYRKLPHFLTRTVRKHFLYVCRLHDKTKIENNFHIEQHSCKNNCKLRQKVPENQYWFWTMLFQFWAISFVWRTKRDGQYFGSIPLVVKSWFPVFAPFARCLFLSARKTPFVAAWTTRRRPFRLWWTGIRWGSPCRVWVAGQYRSPKTYDYTLSNADRPYICKVAS